MIVHYSLLDPSTLAGGPFLVSWTFLVYYQELMLICRLITPIAGKTFTLCSLLFFQSSAAVLSGVIVCSRFWTFWDDFLGRRLYVVEFKSNMPSTLTQGFHIRPCVRSFSLSSSHFTTMKSQMSVEKSFEVISQLKLSR